MTTNAMSDYLENALLNHLFNNTQHTSPANVYLSLHTAVGADEATASWSTTELNSGTATNYARATAGPGVWGAAASGQITLTSDVTFPTAGNNWGTITHVAIWDAASAGNLLFYGEISASRVINSGDAARFATGNLTVILR